MSGQAAVVVVGVDGSPASRAALAYALADAARRGACLRVVAAARMPEYWAMSYGMSTPPPATAIVAAVEEATRQIVSETTAAHPEFTVPVTLVVRAGNPAEVLVAEAGDADLLVVGHRGRGAVASALLGSVGLNCVLHSPCPVTIVRPEAAPVTVAEPATAGVGSPVLA